MTGVAPVPESGRLFNAVCALGPSDIEEASACVFRLKAVCRQRKHDFVSRIALGMALLICGHRDAALQEIEVSWQLRDMSVPAAVRLLAEALFHTHQRERLLDLIDPVFFRPASLVLPGTPSSLALMGIVLGDKKLVSQAAFLERRIGQEHEAQELNEIIENSEIDQFLQGHQNAVMDVLAEHQAWVHLHKFTCDGDDIPMIAIRHYLAVRHEELSLVRQHVHDRLDCYYAGLGTTIGVVAPYLHNSLLIKPRAQIFEVT